MSHDQIVFVEKSEHVEQIEDEYDVCEVYDLDTEGFGLLLDCDTAAEVEELNYTAVENYDAGLEVNLQTANTAMQDSSRADMQDVLSFHNIPETELDAGDITVVVMDSGVNESHPRFSEDMLQDRVDVTDADGVDNVGHGTAVAGQIARIAPGVNVIDLRIFGGNGSSTIKEIVEAYGWLLDNTEKYQFVNMSWGARDRVRKIDQMQNELASRGRLAICAAGNSGEKGGSPATAEKAFSVGSCNERGGMSDFSSYNPDHENPDVTAIGESVVLFRAPGTSMGEPIDEELTVASGTSFSAPNTAGMMIRYAARSIDWTADSLANRFTEYARDIPGLPRDGHGIADYRAAADGEKPEPEPRYADASVWNFIGRDTVFISADWLESGSYRVNREKLLDAVERKE